MSRRPVLILLAALGVAAGLAASATSTSDQAYAQGMRGLALAAVVVVLEVTNVLGTWVWLTDSRTHAKWQAGALVAAASLVTGWCGVLSFHGMGWIGPAFTLGGVHLANLAATTPVPVDKGVSSPADTCTAAEAAQLDGAEPAQFSGEPALDGRVQELADDLVAGAHITGPQAAARFGCSDRTARRLLADARTQLEQAPSSPTDLHLVDSETAGEA